MRDTQSEIIIAVLIGLALGLMMMATSDSTIISTLDVYDVDNSGDFSADEIIQAENDYKSSRLTESDYQTIMMLAVTSTLTDEGVVLPPPEEIETSEPIIVKPVPIPTPSMLPEEPATGGGTFVVAIGLLIGAGISFAAVLWRQSKN
ncbi:MAG: hypothetical protein J7K40_06445 [candidate division Zixibacteria bacterium]|nr:hypothetical protein [candidate division Zixibacteria bacterium]